jgi:hypothetical protein
MNNKDAVETVSRSLPEKADYENVVGTADLLDVKLTNSTFEVQPALFSLPESAKRYAYGCEPEAIHFHAESRRVFGVFALEAGVKSGRKWLFRVRSKYLIIYGVAGDADKLAVETFAERVGAFTCYPYFRAHYANLAGSAGAELPPLPVMRGAVPRNIRQPASS